MQAGVGKATEAVGRGRGPTGELARCASIGPDAVTRPRRYR